MQVFVARPSERSGSLPRSCCVAVGCAAACCRPERRAGARGPVPAGRGQRGLTWQEAPAGSSLPPESQVSLVTPAAKKLGRAEELVCSALAKLGGRGGRLSPQGSV